MFVFTCQKNDWYINACLVRGAAIKIQRKAAPNENPGRFLLYHHSQLADFKS